MSPSWWGCPICGWRIVDDLDSPATSWRNEFRCLLKNVNDGQMTVTGVGAYDDAYCGIFFAPPDFDARYDDEDYDNPDDDIVSTDRDCPVNDKYGFPIHAVCWELLEEAVSPVPVTRVFQVLDSLPEEQTGEQLDWDFCYRADSPESFPWEACFDLQMSDDPPTNADPLATYPPRQKRAAQKALKNRNHIWGRVQKLTSIVKLYRHEVGALMSPWNNAPEPDHERWLMVAASLECIDPVLYPQGPGCRELFHDTISVPDDISCVSVSTVAAGHFRYVSGISLSTTSGHTLTLGYMGHDDEQESVHLNPPGLKGLNIAVGRSGIHAFQCVVSSGQVGWLGRPENAAITRCLGTGNGIEGLRFGFDGFRLVSVAAVLKTNRRGDGSDDSGVALDDSNSTESLASRKLKNVAVWYPCVPPDAAQLNGDVFYPLKSYLGGFKPIFWTQFGGPEGVYLKPLTRISFCDSNRLVFEYDRDDIPDACKAFGRAEEADSDLQDKIHFDVDGPGNERIVKVKIRQKVQLRERSLCQTDGTLASFELTTNLGRHRFFDVNNELEKGWKFDESEFIVKEGTHITGFYGAQYWFLGGLAAFGVITECKTTS